MPCKIIGFFLGLFVTLQVLPAGAAENTSETIPVKTGLQKRIPWQSSRIAGTPDPPAPFAVAEAFPHLKFTRPVLITQFPDSNRMLVAEQLGKIFTFENDPACKNKVQIANLKESHPDLVAIYGLTFHPDFAKNRIVYICYVLKAGIEDGTRVARFTMSAKKPEQIDLKSEKVILTWLSGGHNGGCLKFGPDGYLYITSGDGTGPTPPDVLRAGQDVSNLLSAILRIDVNHPKGNKAYGVPADNPFVGQPGVRPEIWSYGFRNPWKMSFDRKTGDLWVGDVGWEQWEMIYRVRKGGNYGWSIMEGRQQVHPNGKRGPTPILPPTVDHPHSEAASITGGFVYHGKRLKELKGQYIYGDYQSGYIWSLKYDRTKDKVTHHEKISNSPLQIVAFGEDKARELFILDYNRTGKIYQLVKNSVKATTKKFPRRLSETGLFASVSEQSPQPGVIAYSINAHHWADHTTAQHWLAVPGTEPITLNDKGKWVLPDGSVLVKTVSIAMQQDDATSKRRLETQILHREQGSWRPYTYAWNEQQTDADLVDAQGFNKTLEIRDNRIPGGVRKQVYRFASRAECKQCHNPWVEHKTTVFGIQSASPLTMNAEQLNRMHPYPGKPANQLRTFQHIGLISETINNTAFKSKPLVDPYDPSQNLSHRVRSYFHVNCAHCHQYNAGGTAKILLGYDTALGKAKLIGERPTQGAFRITNARLVSPGDPFGSVLYYRMIKLGAGRMPRIGSREIDQQGVNLIHDWIKQLPSSDKPSSHSEIASLDLIKSSHSAADLNTAITRLTNTTRGALELLHLKNHDKLDNQKHQLIVELTKSHQHSEVRDLFETFVPLDQRVQRLGNVVNQAEILNLQGNSERGRDLFFSNTSISCKNCHRIKDQGKVLGPDLSQIGKKYRREQILSNILTPSQIIEPKYLSYMLETKQGRIHTGILHKKTKEQVVLQDTQGKLIEVKQTEVEMLVPQQKSLMPELLLKEMTRQQVADLLAYLASLK